jgi:hypothetical protein
VDVEEVDEDDAPLVQSGRQRKATQVFTLGHPVRLPIQKKRRASTGTTTQIKKQLRNVVNRYKKITDPTIQAIVFEIRNICD